VARRIGKNNLTEADREETLNLWEAHFPNISAMSRALGMSRSGVTNRLKGLGLKNPDGTWRKTPDGPGIDLPVFPDEDIDPERILDHMEERFVQKDAHFHAMKWFKIKVRSDDPIGVCWVGDPHIGPHCNITLLRRDVKIMTGTPGLYAVNVGDTGDNWGGRLIHLWAHTDSSRETERRLSGWFLQGAGIPWLAWLEGNHEDMDGAFTAHLRAINANKIPMIDWRAQFKLCFPSREISVDCAHDFKGHSMWNDLHALGRAARESGSDLADIYVAGHRHLWSHKKEEMNDGRVITLIRARGYKWIDHFAHRHQFAHKRVGATVMTIINPKAESPDGLVLRQQPDGCSGMAE